MSDNNYWWVQVKGSNSLSDGWSALKEWPEVAEVYTTSGDWDYLVKFKSNLDNAQFKSAAWRLRSQQWVRDSASWWSEKA